MKRRCTQTESGGTRCEREAGHEGGCACPLALAVFDKTRSSVFDKTRSSSRAGLEADRLLAKAFLPDDPPPANDGVDDGIPF